MKIEVEVTKNGLVRQSVNRHRIFRDMSRLGGLASLLGGGGGIDDDHKPFEKRGKNSSLIFAKDFEYFLVHLQACLFYISSHRLFRTCGIPSMIMPMLFIHPLWRNST